MKIFNVLVAGSRDFSDYNLLKQKLDLILGNVLKTHSVRIVSGCARGADSLGEKYANEHDLQVVQFPAQWKIHGNKAGYVRNVTMGKTSQAAVIFWDGKSKGTSHMINLARELNLPVRIIRYQ